MLQTRSSFLLTVSLGAFALSALLMPVRAQVASPPESTIALKAALVLAPEFCAKQPALPRWMAGKVDVPVGEASCEEFRLSLKRVFPSLSFVTDASSIWDAQIVLIPRFVDVSLTQPYQLIHAVDQEMLVVMEWTIKDKSGKTIWIETVQGSASHKVSGLKNEQQDNPRLLAQAALHEVAWQTEKAMLASPELRKYAQQNASNVSPATPPAKASPDQISLTIDSVPSGADIEVDGAFVGNTPSMVGVAPGSHKIAVRMKGYADWIRTLNVTGGTIHLSAELEKAPQ
jgi:hypothetical protein